MTTTLTDTELINELKERFEKNEQLFREQLLLMTELKSVNEKLVVSEGLKSNFLSNIRNEINNPVASILELAKNISEGNMSAENIKKFAKLIYSETFGLDFQLRNIFASAEIEAGEAIVSAVSVNIVSLVENTISSFKHQVEKKHIHLHLSSSINTNATFCSDPEKLHLILSNLLSNAIQFSKVGGSVQIRFEIEEGQLCFAILDSGPGISEVNRTIIFDRFRQIEEGSTKTYGGHGLGLCITKSLLELLEGEIMLESEKDKGSLFSIRIKESENSGSQNDIFSSDGNDFLFADSENIVF
ncbi:histidine kinase [Sphingobacteriaceae bacterium]|nr:histidine kinase [Sphingobacteriaceae bacterium]